MGLQYKYLLKLNIPYFFAAAKSVCSLPFHERGGVSGKNYFHKTFFMLKSLICKIFQEGGYEQKGKQAENIFCP